MRAQLANFKQFWLLTTPTLTNNENFRSGFLAVKSHKPLLQPTMCPTISSLEHKHTWYLQLIWMIKRELKSPLLKLHLNVGTIWNIYLPLILDSIITRENSNWWLIEWSDEKNSPPGLDGSMKKIMPHLSKWSNEFARNGHYTFFFFSIHKMSHLGQPTVPIHYFPQSSGRHPVKLSHVNFYCNILGQGVKKYQVSSLLVFYDTSWKTVGLLKMRQSLFLHFEEHSNNFSKINLLSTAPQIKMFKSTTKSS